MNLLEQAQSFATRKHVLDEGQLYGEILPYTHHLAAVAAVLKRFGFDDEEIQVAAWLHDIVEDTPVKLRIIEEHYGEGVALLVGAVTSEPGENRKVRNALTYPKIREAGIRAVALKLADRIANVEFGGRGVSMYKKEHATFQHGIYIGSALTDDGTAMAVLAMQRHLDGLLK